ncbi:TPA: hypothetical protein N0F65_011827 [Lagenidium giganteum]|uniref:General transcription factor 3C polypeptide 5 n=1 Tax=Lagenidium giganteum TaxID=4803 RepID=A0AAV2Z2S0_9STRA|nr:TPA: hypothetical protein N0F65_011827 [Lagenidium giganteum]
MATSNGHGTANDTTSATAAVTDAKCNATAVEPQDASSIPKQVVSSSATAVTHELSLRDEHVRSLVALELPVYARDSNMERVLETVGGLAHLQQTHENKSQFLPVKLRPREPSCKPLFADLTKTQTILLRVKRRRQPQPQLQLQPQDDGDGTDATPKLDAHVVGLVREKYVCEGMADFQYLTAKRFFPAPDAATLERTRATSVCRPSPAQVTWKATLRPYLHVEQESRLEMVPEVFSKVDLPLKYEFRQRSGYQPAETPKKPSSTMTYLNFHDDAPAPATPKPENPVVRRRPVGAHDGVDDAVLRMLQEKLALKPIWLRPKLFVGLDLVERRAARRLLRKLCYVFVDGPWRGSWIRMGYDPRADPDAARYQVIELRNNRELVHSKVTHPSRKRTKKFSGVNPKGPRIVKVTQTSEHDNAQAGKRRRKERFARGETRRSFLVDPSAMTSAGGVADSVDGEGGEGSDSDGDDLADTASMASGSGHAGSSHEKTYEIFGVPLTSANVLFQLDEIDDDDVAAWVACFPKLARPTLLGGWYSTHMFLPLREMVRYRIAALVGRSKAELETRQKRIDVLKKQALIECDEQRPGRGDATAAADEDGSVTLEELQAMENGADATEPSGNATAEVNGKKDRDGTMDEGEEDDEEEEDDEKQAANAAAGRLAAQAPAEEDDDEEDDEEDDEQQAEEREGEGKEEEQAAGQQRATEYTF